MYAVFCKGRKNGKWVQYSKDCDTLEEAEKIKLYGESLMSCDVYGNLIKFKIIKH